jgi:hypothetical protein
LVIDSFGKLFTQSGEIVAEGSCQVDMERGSVTLRPLVDTPLISREREPMRLVLDDGTELSIRAGIIRFRLNTPGTPPGPAYRLFVAGAGMSSPQAEK